MKPLRYVVQTRCGARRLMQYVAMSFTRETLDAAHRHSANHRAELEQSDMCGCFHCRNTFKAAKVDEWIDEDSTALCPHCGIDSVIGSASGFPVCEEKFLQAMYKRWFS
jgi:hypothetical protein